MSQYITHIQRRTYRFDGLKILLAKASPLRSGDLLAGIAAESEEERVAAQICLSNVPLKDFLQSEVLSGDHDEVTRLIYDHHDQESFKAIESMTVGEFREWLLHYDRDHQQFTRLAPGLIPEMVAAVSKIMTNQDLILVAKKCQIVTRFRNTIGLPGTMAVRLQPNHPIDDIRGILASTFDGLMLGCGDAVIGVNPAKDDVGNTVKILKALDLLIHDYQIPTQSCVLAHVTTQLKALEQGAPIDLMFQSIAGTEAANRAFGIDLQLLQEANEATLSLKRGTLGQNVMYFETGQGSCLSANGHFGLDQQTLEARAYGVARHFKPLLVNSVVGFIGPEYLANSKQIIRAGLEDHFCGKLLGLPMGVDICYTNHTDADQDDMDTLLTLLGVAGCTYIMGVPGADDIMLNYQSTSFHDSQYVRQVLGLKPAPEFETWLYRMRILRDNLQLQSSSESSSLLTSAQKYLE